MSSFEVIVVGAGAMGSAAAWQLARRGRRVLALDRYAPPHTLGSTHGRTRIIREAYFEHPLYVPFIRRAYELWDALEKEWGETLFVRTGGLMIGPEEGVLVGGARASAREHAIPHQVLDRDGLARDHPEFRLPQGMVALREERAGVLFPEACIEACLTLARRHGAEVRLGEAVREWTAGDGGARVRTEAGTYGAERLVLAAGPWMPELLAPLRLPLQVERQSFHWFQPVGSAAAFAPDRCPIALWEYAPERIFAAFPDFGDGVKLGIHHQGETTTPETVRRQTTPEEERKLRNLLETFLPAANGPLLDAAVCLYTNTPDHHFVLDHHPASRRVVIASPCSGHGFKFASAVGEAVAALALEESHPLDLSLFRVGRFGTG
jgi:sarcosine oxidase